MGLENLLRVNAFGAFQTYSAPTRAEILEEVEVERVEERSVEKKKDCEIIGISKKRATPRKKVASKKKPIQVEVKVEGDEGNRNRQDFEVYQPIALKGEMELEFERNGKK